MRGATFLLAMLVATLAAQETRTVFEVRYVAAGIIYLDAGTGAGLAEGHRLTVKRLAPGDAESNAQPIAEVTVVSVSSRSAACEINSQTAPLAVGDRAYLAAEDLQAIRIFRAAGNARKYAQVVSFTEGDPLEEELREFVPRPPSPEVNRIRGRASFEMSAIRDRGEFGMTSQQQGTVLRADMTRIRGSYWNFTGYWRGRMNSRAAARQETLRDLINRTYHIGAYYNNPQSSHMIGVGRLLVPWANSVSTIDGGYYGRRLSRYLTLGGFAGTTPDPTAWNYNPNRQIAGAFANWEGGSFERIHFGSTAGLALTRIAWKAERQYAFFENTVMFGRTASVFHNLEADYLVPGRFGSTRSGAAISRSFLTARYQPLKRLTLDLNHNFFRGVPTFDTRLLGTGLLDKLLFQGLSSGVRIELPAGVQIYGTLGRNRRDGDTSTAWNRMYGAVIRNIYGTSVRADLRFSQFSSSFGDGWYRSITLTRDLGERFRLEFQAGEQHFESAVTQQSGTGWVLTNFDWLFGRHYTLGAGVGIYRGRIQSYDQIFINLGYVF